MAKIFTKKVALILLTALIAVSGIIWAVVANVQPKFKSGISVVPAGSYVSGNGTASVLVDNYLYFIGDSVETDSIKYGDNEYFANGKIPDTGIFRVKIEDGQPVLDFEYDNNSKNDAGEKIELQPGDEGYNTKVVGINDWDKIGTKNSGIEAVVPKIAGHDNSAMWVFGNNLIYVSPHNRYDNRGNLLSEYLDFFRVDLDGKNHTLVYTTSSANLTTDKFTVWADSTDNIYIVVHEVDDKVIKTINVKTKKVKTLDKDVDNVVLPIANQYGKSINETLDKVYGGVMSYVYYTKNRDSEKDNNEGNLMYRHAIPSGEPEKIGDDGNENEGTIFTPLAVTPAQNGNTQFVFSVVVGKDNNSVKLTSPKLCLINETNTENYQYVEPSETWGLPEDSTIKIFANGFCTINNNLRYYTVINGSEMVIQAGDLLTGVEKVLTVIGDTIYVQKETVVYKIKPGQSSNSITIVPTATAETENDDDTSSESTNTIKLPVAVLSQPHGDNGEPMIFVQDANHIRLYDNNGNVTYLKFKQD